MSADHSKIVKTVQTFGSFVVTLAGSVDFTVNRTPAADTSRFSVHHKLLTDFLFERFDQKAFASMLVNGKLFVMFYNFNYLRASQTSPAHRGSVRSDEHKVMISTLPWAENGDIFDPLLRHATKESQKIFLEPPPPPPPPPPVNWKYSTWKQKLELPGDLTLLRLAVLPQAKYTCPKVTASKVTNQEAQYWLPYLG